MVPTIPSAMGKSMAVVAVLEMKADSRSATTPKPTMVRYVDRHRFPLSDE